MKITTKNLKAKKKQLVALACEIVHNRDNCCRFCGKAYGKMDAAHIIPRSRGWRYAVDTNNIIKLCFTCHRNWHENPIVGVSMLESLCPQVYDYTDRLHYPVSRVTVSEAQAVADKLEKELKDD